MHRLLVDGVTVEYRAADGDIRGAQARVIDFDDPANNDWLAVNQFTVAENKHTRRPDVVLFVNGLPLAVLELKNAANEDATDLDGVPAAPDLQGGDPVALRDQRRARRLRRRRGARRHAQRRARVVQALAHDRRRAPGRCAPARGAGGDRGHVRAAPLPRPRPRLPRVRGRRRRAPRQEDGGLPPVPRGAGGGGRDAARRGAAPRGLAWPRRRDATRPAGSRAASPATGASAWSGTPRARARA